MIYGLIMIRTKSKKIIREIKIGKNFRRQIIIMREFIIVMSMTYLTLRLLSRIKHLLHWKKLIYNLQRVEKKFSQRNQNKMRIKLCRFMNNKRIINLKIHKKKKKKFQK